MTESLFAMDGDVGPVEELLELAAHHWIRLVVNEAHATGTIGPNDPGAVAEAGLDHEVDVIIGTLGKALGSYGAFVACGQGMARPPVKAARTFIFSTTLPPTAAASALTALELLQERPRLVDKLAANASTLRAEIASQGFEVRASRTQTIPLIVGAPELAMRICDAAISRGVFAEAIPPPTVPQGTSRLRVAVMASHRTQELRRAGELLGDAARAYVVEDRRPEPCASERAKAGVFDFEARAA